MRSWVDVADASPFPITNLPYGSFTAGDRSRRRLGVAIGAQVLDLAAVLPEVESLGDQTLNRFMALGRATWDQVRARIIELLTNDEHRPAVEPHLIALTEVALHLPFDVADYVDFYSSEQHARNVGQILRPGQPELLPNWKHLPVGYHGRAGTVRVSGTPVNRPHGQRKDPADALPTHGPSERLDIEAEVGWVVGVPSELGQPVPLAAFRDHVFGCCLVNDWSARDLQAWEYVPLGPFLAKSFLTSLSPWVVPLAALDAAWIPPPVRDEPLLPYLDDSGHADGVA